MIDSFNKVIMTEKHMTMIQVCALRLHTLCNILHFNGLKANTFIDLRFFFKKMGRGGVIKNKIQNSNSIFQGEAHS